MYDNTAYARYRASILNDGFIDEAGMDGRVSQSRRQDAREFASRQGIVLRSVSEASALFLYMKGMKRSEKLISRMARKMGCGKNHLEHALELARRHMFLVSEEHDARDLLIQASHSMNGGMGTHVLALAKMNGFSDPVAAAVKERYNANGAPQKNDAILGWLGEEKKFQADPFNFAWTVCGNKDRPDPMKARAVGIAMGHMLQNGGMPGGLAPLSRREQVLALLKDPKYAGLAEELARKATARSAEETPKPIPPTPTVDSPHLARSKELLNEAASKYIEMRRVRSRDMEALRIIREYPALPLVLQRAYKAATGEEIPIEDATSLLVEGPKSKEGRRSGRAGLLQFFESLQQDAEQSLEVLQNVVKREKRKLDNGSRNMHEEKKAELNGWLAVQQMPSVIRELIVKFGKGSESIDTFSAYALTDALEHVRKTGMVVDTQDKAMGLFQHMRWKSRVTYQMDGRVSSGLMSRDAAEEAKLAMLQDERLKELKGFPSSDAEIDFYTSLYQRRGEPYPARLITHLLHKRGDISDAVYKDIEKRFNTESPSISDIGGLNRFISDSWKVAARERVASNKARGMLPEAVSNRVLKIVLEDDSAKGKFDTPHKELALYIRACQELNEPYPARLSLFIFAEDGRIPQEVLGSALMRIHEEKLVFMDGNEFGQFVEKVREHVLLSDPLTSGRKSYARDAFQGTMQAGSEDSGLIAIETGHGLHPHPAPSIPPSSESISIPVELSPGRAKAGPAAEAQVFGKTTEIRAPVLPHAAPTGPEPFDAEKTTQLPAPQLPGALPTAPPAIQSAEEYYEKGKTTQLKAPDIPAAILPKPAEPEGMETTRMPAPAFPEPGPADDAREAVATSQLPAPSLQISHAPTISAPPPVIGEEVAPRPAPHPAPRRVDTSPAVRALEKRFFGSDDPLASPAPPQLMFQPKTAVGMPVPQQKPPAQPEPAGFSTAVSPPSAELLASSGRDTILDEEAADDVIVTLESPDAPPSQPKKELPSNVPQILRSIGYFAHLVQKGAAQFVPIPGSAPEKPHKADSEIFLDLLESTLFSDAGPGQREAAATLLAANAAPDRLVPLLLRAHCAQPDISAHCIRLLSSGRPEDVIPNAFKYRKVLRKSNVLDSPILRLAEEFGPAAIPHIVSYISAERKEVPSMFEDSDVSLALEMVKGVENNSMQLLEELLPAIDSVSETQKLGIANLAKAIGPAALQPVVSSVCGNPSIGADSALILSRAARDISGGSEDGAEVLSSLFPMMERMTAEQCSMAGVIADKFGKVSLKHMLAHARSGNMGPEPAAVLCRAAESIGDESGKGLLKHTLPLIGGMAEDQVQRVEDLAVRFNCSGIIFDYCSSRGKNLAVQEALLLGRILAQTHEVHKNPEGAAFVPFLMRLVDSMNSEQAEIVKAYAIRFGGESVEHVESYVSFRGDSLTPREAATAAYILASIPSEFAYQALKSILKEGNLPESRILEIHNAAKAELIAAYSGEAARDAVVRSAVREKGPISALGAISFEIIEEMESGPMGPSADIIKSCINQHLTREVDTGDNSERLMKSRELLVKFGDYAIDNLWAIGLSPDFSLYPAEHRTNIFRTLAHIAERSGSAITKQKARECLMDAVKNHDLSNQVIASALTLLRENVVCDMFKMMRANQSNLSQDRICGIMLEMGETAQRQVSELLCSRDAYERFAGATMLGLMFMAYPKLGRTLSSERAMPEAERRLPSLQDNVRMLPWMLFDPKSIEGSNKDTVAGAAEAALRTIGGSLDAGELEKVVRHSASDLSAEEEYAREVECGRIAAGLIALTGAKEPLAGIFGDRSIDLEVRKHALAESMALGDEMLAMVASLAREAAFDEKYLTINAAFRFSSPFSQILQMIELGQEEWKQKLPSAGLESGKMPEQWQEDLLRWTVVRGIVLRGSSTAAEFAHELCYSLGYIKLADLAKDLRHAVEKQARDTGMLPSTKMELMKYCIDLLASKGINRRNLEEGMLAANAVLPGDKYGGLLQKFRKGRQPQPVQQRIKRNVDGA